MPETTTTDPKPTKKNGAPLKNAPGRVPPVVRAASAGG
jgi:hypothetical protein